MKSKNDSARPSDPAQDEHHDTSQGQRVVCDWGSSHLRAYLVGADGSLLREYQSSQGAKSIAGNQSIYTKELRKALEELQAHAENKIYISGMAGSKLGWFETNYSSTPLTAADFQSNKKLIPGFEHCFLFGGVQHTDEDGSIDVMRGEEVQVFGVADQYPDARLVCLPGTHSKWVHVKDSQLLSFKTYMTGDLFYALSKESIFREQMTSKELHHDAFVSGCRLAQEGNNVQDLFKLRSSFVFSKVSSEEFYSYLSGFLIMNEILAVEPQHKVHLCGSAPLMSVYAIALDQLGVESLAIHSETATILGHSVTLAP